jgi:hypothetical protein
MTKSLLATALILALASCKEDAKPAAAAPAPAAVAPAAPAKEGHSHAEHPGHVAVNTKLGALDVEIHFDSYVDAGKTASIGLVLPKEAKVPGLRGWIGKADGKGSVKALGHVHDGEAETHFDVEVPSPLAADAKLFIEGEVAGAKQTLELPLPVQKR